MLKKTYLEISDPPLPAKRMEAMAKQIAMATNGKIQGFSDSGFIVTVDDIRIIGSWEKEKKAFPSTSKVRHKNSQRRQKDHKPTLSKYIILNIIDLIQQNYNGKVKKQTENYFRIDFNDYDNLNIITGKIDNNKLQINGHFNNGTITSYGNILNWKIVWNNFSNKLTGKLIKP